MATIIRAHDDGGYLLTKQMILPQPREDIFPFFADAGNLEQITPPQLRFRIVTPEPIVMREGLVIDYRLRVRGLPVRWQTEIPVWEPPYRFVDRARRSPYRYWVHEHTFEPTTDGGTIVRDEVRYDVPGGRIVHQLFVRRELMAIFDYRAKTLRELFGATAADEASTAAGGLPLAG